MKKFVLVFLLTFATLLLGAESNSGSFSVTLSNLEKYESLSFVNSTEYKFLVNPAFFVKSRKAGYAKVWKVVKSIAENSGYAVVEARQPYKEELSTKEYMDTPDFKLRKMGYVLRRQEKYKNGKPSGKYKYTGKYISTDLSKILGSDFGAALGVKYSSKIEDNVSLTAANNFKDYFELAIKVKSKKNLGYKLKDYAQFYPKMLNLGLSGDTELVGKKVYSYTTAPGEIVFGKRAKVEVEIEVWTRKKNGKPFVIDCSYTLKTKNYSEMVDALIKAEGFLKKLGEEASNLKFPDFERYKGSKVRVLLNLPVR